MQKRLAKHLKAVDGNLGRTGHEVKLLARLTGMTTSMIQSVALGRRKFSDNALIVVTRELAKLEQLEKERKAMAKRILRG